MTSVAFAAPNAEAKRSLRVPPGAVDAAFVIVLGALGLVGFRSLYGGVAYLFVGLLGIALGIAVTELARKWGQPVLAEAFVALVAFVLLGGAVAAPKSTLGGILPTASTLRALGHVGIYGWKELLTTPPPVGNSSDLLALPYIAGLVCGVAGQSVARRTRLAALPLAGPVLILALGILFGARHPASLALQGSVFVAVALAWIVVRHHRYRPIVTERRVGRNRLVLSVALLALAGLGAGVVGPHLPGSGRSRVVLSRYVVPPFEANSQPSPLAGFRQFAKGGPLNGKVLFTVKGLDPLSLVRIATMDAYDGIVWGFGAGSQSGTSDVSGAFQRFGSSIPASVTGPTARISVRIGSLSGVWVPEIGQATRVSFTGPSARTDGLTAGFRYDTATQTAAEPGGISAGDTYTLTAIAPRPPSPGQVKKAAAGDVKLPLSGVPTILQTDANQWAGGSSSAWGKVMAIALHLRKYGYRSDGLDPSNPDNPMLSTAGHGSGRLTTFLKGGGLVGTDIVGNDEQYAAALALMANSVGVPARVVLGAQVVEQSGAVRGSDVHAWVEVSLSGLGWVPIRWDQFVPTQPAHETPPTKQPQASSSAPVEPPVVSALHAPIGEQLPGNSTDAVSRSADAHRSAGFTIPAWLRTLALAVLVPALVVASVSGAIVGLKRRRRRRRRRAATTTSQISGAWAELIDQARDLGHALPGGRTRREQAVLLAAPEATVLASRADAAVFAPSDATEHQAAEYWVEVERFAGSLRSGLGRWRRWRAACSLRSLRLAEFGPGSA